jgi:hypothetical protein
MDGARAVENEERVFHKLVGRRTKRAAHTVHRPCLFTERRRTKTKTERDYNHVLHEWRLIDNPDVLASLRSDHDHVECVITMAWTK